MAGTSAQGGWLTFNGTTVTITSISVETPVAELVNMTGTAHAANISMIVPTGAWSGGTVSVDYIHAVGQPDPKSLVRTVGTAVFSSVGYSVSRCVVLESATTQAQTGDIVRGTMKFVCTDYTGTSSP